jgi:adhesin transport system outer membrane protein
MLKTTYTDYEGQLEAAYAGYREITGIMPQSDLVMPPVVGSMLEDDVDEAIRLSKQAHPVVLSGIKDLEAAGYDVKAERAAYWPELDGELSYLKRDQKEEIGGEVDDGRALLKLSWNFETGGAQNARTKQKKAAYSEVLSKNSEIARIIEADIRRAYSEYETAKKQVELSRKREVVTEDLFEAYKTQFEGARVRLLQLMQAENQLFNAQLEGITAQYRYLLAQYGILASTGQLTNSMSSLPAISLEEEIREKNEAKAAETERSAGNKEEIVSTNDENLTEQIVKTVK